MTDLELARVPEPWMVAIHKLELDYAKKQFASFRSPDPDPVPDGVRDQARQEGD